MLIRCTDVETTGLDPAVHRVCEVATVDLVVDHTKAEAGDLICDHGGGIYDYKVVPVITRGRMWSSLVNPTIPIPPEASAVHDITDAMVEHAPKLFDVMDRIVTDPDPDYYCAHNNRFDMRFLDQTVLRRPWLDTYRIALWLWPSAPDHKLATLRYWLKLNLVQVFEHPPPTDVDARRNVNRSHTAEWDAYVCAAVLRRAFMTGAKVEQMVDVSSQPALLPRFTFGKWAMKPIEEVESGYLDWILTTKDMDEDVKHTARAELQRRRNLATLHS